MVPYIPTGDPLQVEFQRTRKCVSLIDSAIVSGKPTLPPLFFVPLFQLFILFQLKSCLVNMNAPFL